MATEFQAGVDWGRWFVDPSSDVRSSGALEIAASEFKCQGLELDFVGLCWGDDFLWDGFAWERRKLSGSKWQRDRDISRAANSYRVLLTRARYGMAIWVPDVRGRNLLLTNPDSLDATAEALVRSGLTLLD